MAAAHAARHASNDVFIDLRTTLSLLCNNPEDWTIDMNAAMCLTTDIRRLEQYPLEYLFTLPQKSRLFLLVVVDANNHLLSGLAKHVKEQQSNGRITLSGREYY